MTQRKVPWSYEEVALKFTYKAATYLARRYAGYADLDDIAQEISLWLYGEGKPKVERWLANSPQQTTRIYRSMIDQGMKYAEAEKAEKVGYRPDDIAWYTPRSVEALMPLVLDSTYTRPKGKVDDLLTLVLDIRRVLTDELRLFFLTEEPGHVEWADKVQDVVNRLGGTSPYRRRRVVSNAQAQAITRDQE